jgi:hypothetical protein
VKTPRYISETIAAAGRTYIGASGQYVTVISISASTVYLGVDDDPPQQIIAGLRFPIPTRYSQLVLYNAGLVASTVVLYVADALVDLTSDSLMTAMLASLTAIQARQELQGPYGTLVEVGQTVVAQTGVGATQIIAANALNCEVEIVCDMGNAGYVYLAETNAVTQAASITELQAGGSWNRKWNGDVYACSTNGIEQVRASIWRQ